MTDILEENSKTVALPTPKLDQLETLYVKSYLHTMSHIAAHRTVAPTLKNHHNDNTYSRRANIQYYINSALQNRAEALAITPSRIMELLYHEATSYGRSSNQNARIQALNILGKQLGLFQEKVNENTAPIINIVHYQHPASLLSSNQDVPSDKPTLEHSEASPLPKSEVDSFLARAEVKNDLPVNIHINSFNFEGEADAGD